MIWTMFKFCSSVHERNSRSVVNSLHSILPSALRMMLIMEKRPDKHVHLVSKTKIKDNIEFRGTPKRGQYFKLANERKTNEFLIANF